MCSQIIISGQTWDVVDLPDYECQDICYAYCDDDSISEEIFAEDDSKFGTTTFLNLYVEKYEEKYGKSFTVDL